MLRLTLRSRDDGRFLARIIDRDGFAFVLDFGDTTMVADASERVTRGFSLWRDGRLETVAPSSPDLLPMLAEFYAQEGLDVVLDENDASKPAPDAVAPIAPLELGLGVHEPGDETELQQEPTEETELVSFADLPDLGPDLEAWEPPRRTNPGALQKRALWRPPGTPTPQPVVPRKRRAPEPVAAAPVIEPVVRSSDEEETELVSADMRRAAMNEEDQTELDYGSDRSVLHEEEG